MSTLFTRRRFLLATLAAGTAAGSAASYARWFESTHLKLSQHRIATSREPHNNPCACCTSPTCTPRRQYRSNTSPAPSPRASR